MPGIWNVVPTDFAVRVAVRKALEKAGVPFAEDYGLDGYQADFVFRTADGKRHLIEAKGGKQRDRSVSRAADLARHLRQLPVDSAFVVVPSMDKESPSRGVVSVSGLEKILKDAAPAGEAPAAAPRASPASAEQPLVFAAMPFAPRYDDVFFVAIRGAAKLARCVARRVDQEEYVGDVVARIASRIAQAKAVIVDLSESRPNVLYEMGYAQASGKPVVAICSTPTEKLPFDVRNLNVLRYAAGQTHRLRPRLARRLRAALKT